ncbi:hypothetical protein PL8927_510008 [Planktothrix serta PCC 8927]|uniref:Uncharacterized protein n=1 Tax=Planktothrix serta PCC 8927 TaxID=671068 RepID=A0A7Z9BKG6_9CYAN|nr:hypothetical protein [Planktothrix serta]VXD15973.1 hypothetical protein PL8927_510008 [Planktothrix serta PCC 8927]
MNSSSIAKIRLLKDSIGQKKLADLKQDAAELGLSSDDVKTFGTLTLKQTWINAIGEKIAQLFDELGESAIISHGDGDDHTEGVEPGGTTPNTITQKEETMDKELHLSSVQVAVPELAAPDPNEDEDDDDDDDDDDVDEEELAAITIKHVSPICSDIILALPTFNYYQLIAFHYGVLLAHQDLQPVAYAMELLDYDRFPPEQSFSLKLHEFVPDLYERDRLVLLIKGLKSSIFFKKPENCCPACGGAGNIFAGVADHLIDWETCPKCDGKGFLEPVPSPSDLPTIEEIIGTIPSDSGDCPDCDGTGEILDFSGEDNEPCPTCSEPEPKTEPKLSQPDVNVNVLVNFVSLDAEYSRRVEAIAKSFDGNCWFSGYSPGNYEENWSFGSYSFASNFKEQCQSLPFVQSATIDRIASNTPITPPVDTSLYASDFEKETVIAFYREEGSTPEELEEVRRQPLTKMDAAIVLGYAEHYKKSAEIALRLYLVDWINDINLEREQCANRTDKLLLNWKTVTEAKAKIAYQFQLRRPGEINCFCTPDGWRISAPQWVKEEILTQKEAEFLSPDDPVVELMGNGYLFALEKFKEQVSLSLVDLSPFPLTHENSPLA